MPPHASLKNPIDLTVESGYDKYDVAVEQAFSEYDSIIAINVTIPYFDSNGIARGIIDATQKENKPVLTNFMADRIVRETNGPLNEAGLVNLATGERYAFVWSTRTEKKRLLARIRLASTH